MGMLCQELTNEQAAPHNRTAAGIAFKNALSAKACGVFYSPPEVMEIY
jgi:hypothetical protein